MYFHYLKIHRSLNIEQQVLAVVSLTNAYRNCVFTYLYIVHARFAQLAGAVEYTDCISAEV